MLLSLNEMLLSYIGSGLNSYEQAISIIGKTLAAFDEDNLIPCYGFGDASTHDQDVFSFYPDYRFCNGFEAMLSQYRESSSSTFSRFEFYKLNYTFPTLVVLELQNNSFL
ncbi:hypothetical protein ACSBR1_014676 [Camellia fascicularis]